MKIIFIKKHMLFGTRKMVVGSKANVMMRLGNELIDIGVAQRYSGKMNEKTKINLSNLK
jgi:hypothetical protein